MAGPRGRHPTHYSLLALHALARWPNSTFCASLSSAMLRRYSSPTARPRATAGRASIVSNQRLRWGKSSRSWPWFLCGLIQPTAGHVGDRIGAGQELAVGEALVHHAVEAIDLVGVAVDAVADLFRRILAEMMGLASHRPETADLPEQPLVDLGAAALVGGIELAELAAEILQDRARLEDRDRLAHCRRGGPRDRRSPACGCWARSSGTPARTARPCRC